jgi:SAM-dependent methyltransferase
MRGQTARYNVIGAGYVTTRRTDPRIAAAITAALGDAASVVNVGAGAGSYEPTDRPVVAVEPSATMIAQRPIGAGPVVQAVAEQLPFADGAFAAATAFMTIHHWPDQERGLQELRRVARQRALVLTADLAFADTFWLVRDYLPEVAAVNRARFLPLARIMAALGAEEARVVAVPRDCTDAFLGAYWGRPELYLDLANWVGMSELARLGKRLVRSRLQRLAEDLHAGTWDRTYGELRAREALDLGLRLIVAEY